MKRMSDYSQKRGFTIVELVITIAIMAIFIALSFVSFEAAQVNSRDTERKADVQSIANNLETFYGSGSKGADTCPKGFIGVPGSVTYGTSNFCVMKYEAKQDSNGKAVSVANGLPWTSISQVDATTAAAAVCNGCHLITEAEWMTIAQNVLQQPSNWSGGSVGNGFIYNGHAGSNPANALSADFNDSNSNYGETSYDNSNIGANNKRTLTLSNGEVIWDLAGNIWEWTQGRTTGPQPGLSGDTGYVWGRQWNTVTQNGFSTSSMPLSMASGVLSSINSWTTGKGIGGLSSYYSETVSHGFIRGDYWSGGSNAGVLALGLNNTPVTTSTYIGFRVTYSDSNKNIVTTQAGRYPSTAIVGQESKVLGDLDADSIVAPNTNKSDDALIAATNNTQTTSGVSPQPTINQYVYQPLQSDGSLCSNSTQRCTEFNIYYRLETDNAVYKITSKHQ